MPTITLPERFKIIHATSGCVTSNGGITGNYISAKTGQMVTLVLSFKAAVGFANVITLKEATSVAGAAVQTMANVSQVWSNLDTGTNDTLVRRTDATGYTLSTATTPIMVVFQINPTALSEGFDCIGFTISDSSQAASFVSGMYYIENRYPQATPPSAVID